VNRYGIPYPSKKESFVHANWTGKTSRVLSLFTISKNEDVQTEWQVIEPNESWRIKTPEGSVKIVCTQSELRAIHETTGAEWSVSLKDR
jgi:hypothetical protein